MATKMNMLKLLQEVRGFIRFAHRQTESRPSGPLLLQFYGSQKHKRAARRKQFIKIEMQEPTDIPHPVPIIYRKTTDSHLQQE
jgi:hypothetical protein